jgi:hypothetical protein
MRLFKCQACGQILHFENTLCETCSHRLGYLSAATTMSAIEPEGDAWKALASPGTLVRFCDNARHGSCNWLIETQSSETLCLCCRHNHTIPDISQDENAQAWRKIEWAKHRLFYSLVRLKLPLATKLEQAETGLAFDFLADPTAHGPKVKTGHDNGLITIALKEADDAEREKSRIAMHEPYRTQPFDRLTENWMPLTIALNSLNRSMGQPDLYPFVLSTPALEKLAFVHALVHPGRSP